MITVELVSPQRKGSPYTYRAVPRDVAEAAVATRVKFSRNPDEASSWELLPVPACPCCGEPAWENGRCTKHQDRNPCVVEGCTRTRKAQGMLAVDHFICGVHWKRYVPPGSPGRRAVQRLVRLAKRAGYTRTQRWPAKLENRYWRLWQGIVRRVRAASTEGRLDVGEIHKLFGWDDAEG